MRFARARDLLDNFVIVAALAVTAAVAGSCSHALPDLGKVARGQFSRTVEVDGQECPAWIPLVVRASVGQEIVALALEAAQPWTDALGFALAVPAVGDEPSNVDIVVRPCPDDRASDSFPYCSIIAQTAGACVDGAYRQTITLFYVGSASAVIATLTHELGHALGVHGGGAHSQDPASIMFPTTPLAVSKARPLAQSVLPADVESLRAAWSTR